MLIDLSDGVFPRTRRRFDGRDDQLLPRRHHAPAAHFGRADVVALLQERAP